MQKIVPTTTHILLVLLHLLFISTKTLNLIGLSISLFSLHWINWNRRIWRITQFDRIRWTGVIMIYIALISLWIWWLGSGCFVLPKIKLNLDFTTSMTFSVVTLLPFPLVVYDINAHEKRFVLSKCEVPTQLHTYIHPYISMVSFDLISRVLQNNNVCNIT